MPSRKETRLKNFDYSEQGAYFITICTENRKNVLSEIAEHERSNVVGEGWLKYRITKEINSTKNVIEKVFQRSFYDHIVRGRADYEEIFRYVYENPARWKTDELYNDK